MHECCRAESSRNSVSVITLRKQHKESSNLVSPMARMSMCSPTNLNRLSCLFLIELTFKKPKLTLFGCEFLVLYNFPSEFGLAFALSYQRFSIKFKKFLAKIELPLLFRCSFRGDRLSSLILLCLIKSRL